MRRILLTSLLLLAAPASSRADSQADLQSCQSSSGDKSIEACSRVIATPGIDNAQRANAFFERGIARSNSPLLAERNSARGDFEQAIKLRPDYAEALDALGDEYYKEKNYDAAITAYTKSIKANPSYLLAYYNRAIAYASIGDQGRAIADYARAEAITTPKPDRSDERLKRSAKARIERLLEDLRRKANPSAVSQVAQLPLKRMALLIANSNYTTIRKLDNPKADVAAVAKVLRDLGFEVFEEYDLGKEKLRSATRRFAVRVEKERPDWALVYYSGHGVETRQGALILSVDVLEAKDGEKPSLLDVEEDATRVGAVLERLQDTKALTLVVFDACREDGQLAEFARRLDMKAAGISDTRGLRGAGLRWGHNGILYSTADGTFAWDGEPGQLSAFARSFITAIRTEGLELKDLVKRLYDDVEKTTAKVMKTPQRPELRGQIEGKHYFRPVGPAGTIAKQE